MNLKRAYITDRYVTFGNVTLNPETMFSIEHVGFERNGKGIFILVIEIDWAARGGLHFKIAPSRAMNMNYANDSDLEKMGIRRNDPPPAPYKYDENGNYIFSS